MNGFRSPQTPFFGLPRSPRSSRLPLSFTSKRRGELSLDDRIGDYLPNYPAAGQRITIRDLLSHTSGLSDVAVIPIFEEGGVGYTRERIIDLVASQPLDFEPGTGHSYSNVGFIIAGMVIEEATGTTYGDYVTDEILEPLGLEQTRFCPDEQPADARWAHGYDPQHGNWSRALRLGRPPALVVPPPSTWSSSRRRGDFAPR